MRTTIVTLVDTRCSICSAPFAVSKTFWDRGWERGGNIYCPAGHVMTFGKGSLKEAEEEAVRLRARLDQAQATAEHERNRANGYKGAHAKTKRRIAKGVCPCCNRQFVNVEQHMASKHPDFGE